MLRCVPDAAHVAQVLGQAWAQARGMDASPVAATAAARGMTVLGDDLYCHQPFCQLAEPGSYTCV